MIERKKSHSAGLSDAMASPKELKLGDKKLKTLQSFEQTMGDAIVELAVGSNKKIFKVHQELLCTKIPYFDKMFRSGFKEANTQKADFPQDSVEAFDILLEWVYYDRIRALECAGGQEASWEMNDIYKLGDKLCIPNFCDAIMDEYIRSAKAAKILPNTTMMSVAFDMVPAGSPLRKFMILAYRHVMHYDFRDDENWTIPMLSDLLHKHADFSLALLTSIRETPITKDPRKMPACRFHSHDGGECYLSKK